jgi:hypothetical protein
MVLEANTMNYRQLVQTVSQYIPNPIAIELNKWVDELRKDNDTLREEIKAFKSRIVELEAPGSVSAESAPSCPNCSTSGRPYFMSPLPVDFLEIENATHECPKCGFKKRA